MDPCVHSAIIQDQRRGFRIFIFDHDCRRRPPLAKAEGSEPQCGRRSCLARREVASGVSTTQAKALVESNTMSRGPPRIIGVWTSILKHSKTTSQAPSLSLKAALEDATTLNPVIPAST